MEHSFYELKVKRASLAAEARIIKRLAQSRLQQARRVEAKYGVKEGEVTPARRSFESLETHRRKVVGQEARCTHLAAMFLRGVDRQDVEHPLLTKTLPSRDRVEAIVTTFCKTDKRELLQNFAQWWDHWSTPEARRSIQAREAARRQEVRAGKPARDAARKESRAGAMQTA